MEPPSRSVSQPETVYRDDSTVNGEIEAILGSTEHSFLVVKNNGKFDVKEGGAIKKFFYQLFNRGRLKVAITDFIGRINKNSKEGKLTENMDADIGKIFMEKFPPMTSSRLFNISMLDDSIKQHIPNLITSTMVAQFSNSWSDARSGDDIRGFCRLFSIMMNDSKQCLKYTKDHPELDGDVKGRMTGIISKINKYRLNITRLEATLQKVKNIKEALAKEPPGVISEADRFTYEDLRTIDGALWIKKTYENIIEYGLLCEGYIIPELQATKELYTAFDDRFDKIFFEGYEPGHIVFYDLAAKAKFGNGVARLQKLYDRYSHMAIYNHGKVTHSRGVKENPVLTKEIITPVRIAFMPKLEVDFNKVFNETLTQEIEDRISTLYKEKMLERTSNPGQYKFSGSNTLSGARMILTARKYVADPSVRLTEKTDAKVQTAAQPIMCSGFVAGMIYEVMKEIRNEINGEALPTALTFRKSFSQDVSNMTPRDIKRWNIWSPSPPSEELQGILSSDVLKGMTGLERWVQ